MERPNEGGVSLKINVMDTWAIMVEDDTLRQNATKTYNVEFNFDKCWDGYSKTAIFEAGPASVIVALTEDRCNIPSECLKHGSTKLQIGIYGVKGEERKGTIWCLASMIIPDATLKLGGLSSGTPLPDDLYSEIMGAIGDLAAAGFEGKTLAEAFQEIKNSVCETATDTEVNDALNIAFGTKTPTPEDSDTELPTNTATDKEVSDLLNDVFG